MNPCLLPWQAKPIFLLFRRVSQATDRKKAFEISLTAKGLTSRINGQLSTQGKEFKQVIDVKGNRNCP